MLQPLQEVLILQEPSPTPQKRSVGITTSLLKLVYYAEMASWHGRKVQKTTGSQHSTAQRNIKSTASTVVPTSPGAQALSLRENTGFQRARPGLVLAVPTPTPPPQPWAILQPITVPPQQLGAPDSADKPHLHLSLGKYTHQAGSPLSSHCQPWDLLAPLPTFSPLTGMEPHRIHPARPRAFSKVPSSGPRVVWALLFSIITDILRCGHHACGHLTEIPRLSVLAGAPALSLLPPPAHSSSYRFFLTVFF